MNPVQPLTPHGPTFSFVDTCDIFEQEKRALGSKFLDPKDAYFAGHFPGKPLMPGVLLIECCAQTAGVLWQVLSKADAGTPLFLAQVLNFRFMKPALPGETLRIEATLEKELGALALFGSAIWVAHDTIAQGKFILSRDATPPAQESPI